MLFPQYLHRDESVIHHDFFRQEISTYCGFVLITELLIHILVHQRGLSNSRKKKKSQDNIQSSWWAETSDTEKVTVMNSGWSTKKGSMLPELEWAYYHQTRLNALIKCFLYSKPSGNRSLLLSQPFITHPESPRMMTLSSTFFLDVIVPQL